MNRSRPCQFVAATLTTSRFQVWFSGLHGRRHSSCHFAAKPGPGAQGGQIPAELKEIAFGIERLGGEFTRDRCGFFFTEDKLSPWGLGQKDFEMPGRGHLDGVPSAGWSNGALDLELGNLSPARASASDVVLAEL
jgi:hypothetical protein